MKFNQIFNIIGIILIINIYQAVAGGTCKRYSISKIAVENVNGTQQGVDIEGEYSSVLASNCAITIKKGYFKLKECINCATAKINVCFNCENEPNSSNCVDFGTYDLCDICNDSLIGQFLLAIGLPGSCPMDPGYYGSDPSVAIDIEGIVKAGLIQNNTVITIYLLITINQNSTPILIKVHTTFKKI